MINSPVSNNRILKIDKETILNTIYSIEEELSQLEDLTLPDTNAEDTAIIIIDMIKGFAKEGSLSSIRVNNLIPDISVLLSSKKSFSKVFICDSHPQGAVEFSSYPIHAVTDSEESQIVEELLPYVDDRSVVIHKNSTNGMGSEGFKTYLQKHPEINNFILIGDCTDICILQCALGLKAHFNELNILKRVIVPYAYVETYDLEANNHCGDLMNLFALYNMRINGVELYKGISL